MTTQRPTKLRLRRLSIGARILDVSLESGISTTRVSEIERGAARAPSVEEVRRLNWALDRLERATDDL